MQQEVQQNMEVRGNLRLRRDTRRLASRRINAITCPICFSVKVSSRATAKPKIWKIYHQRSPCTLTQLARIGRGQ